MPKSKLLRVGDHLIIGDAEYIIVGIRPQTIKAICCTGSTSGTLIDITIKAARRSGRSSRHDDAQGIDILAKGQEFDSMNSS